MTRNLSDALGCFSAKTVIDVGANEGESVIKFKTLWPDARMICFEPRPRSYSKLLKVASQYADVATFQLGLGNKNASVIMNEIVSDNGYCGRSTLLKYIEMPPGCKSEEIEIEIVRLDDLGLTFEGEMFIKIDVEGCAKQVIDGGMETIRLAGAALIEVNLINKYERNQTKHDDVENRMISLGFNYLGPIHRAISGGIALWQDELYMK